MSLVVNVSRKYNLGAEKLRNWLDHAGGNTLYISALFTWEVPDIIKIAKWFSSTRDIEIGGPAATLMADYIYEQTGIMPHRGLDKRFDCQLGLYFYSFTHRGCPKSCPNCAVPIVEPGFFEYKDFEVANIIGDNNIIACSQGHQERVVEKILNSGMEWVDFNSGFDVELFQPEHFELYSRLRLKTWRFAFDHLWQEQDLRRCIAILKDGGIHGRHSVTVYCLVNYKDTPEEAEHRARVIYELGALPFIMVYRPLDWLKKERWLNEHWERRQLADFASAWNQSKYWGKGNKGKC